MGRAALLVTRAPVRLHSELLEAERPGAVHAGSHRNIFRTSRVRVVRRTSAYPGVREQKFYGAVVGRHKRSAKTELEKLKYEDLTCREAVKHLARMCVCAVATERPCLRRGSFLFLTARVRAAS